MPDAKVTSKGQVTIPLEVREALGVDAGDYLAFEVQADYVVVRRRQTAREVSRALRGRFEGLKRSLASDDEAVEVGIVEDFAAEDHSAGLKLVRVDPGRHE